MSDILEKLYSDPRLGLTAKNLFTNANVDGKFTMKQIKDFLASKASHVVNKRVRKSKNQRQIVALAPGHIYQIDLTDMSVYSKSNQGVKYLLTAVDVDSRYAWAIPLKDKTAASVLEAFKKILADGKPISVSSDNGSEFKGVFAQYLKDNGINQTHQPGDHNHMGIVESFHRTLRSRIAKYLTIHKTTKYVDRLDDILFGYNDAVHKTTKEKPIDIFNLKASNKQKLKEYKGVEFAVGDNVRILNDKKLFNIVRE